MSNSQAGQDLFVLKALGYKRNGTFLEIGANHPQKISNTYLLEKTYGWKGLMVEYSEFYKSMYEQNRVSAFVINDAREVDYNAKFQELQFPSFIDYLQVDLEVDNGSTIQTLEVLNSTVMDKYTFGVVTFEHDIYRGDFYNTRTRSREIFKSRGYRLLYEDVQHEGSPFEDWYVHPSVVDIAIPSHNVGLNWKDIINSLP